MPPRVWTKRLIWPWLGLCLGLQAVTFMAYQPAWHGGLLWDDDGHLTPAALRDVQGLWRIWFDVGATQQYYPLLHSWFWFLHRLWGEETLGYHLVSIGLHAVSAFLVALILRRLHVPGAVLAAAVFALHPVHAESVAWISEMKNTLSGVFYLAAALAYLRFDERQRPGAYAAALGIFVLALLSKTVTATLPAALLVIFWWRRGHLRWRSDVVPLVPFFAIGAAAGLMTVWVEQTIIGADRSGVTLSFVDRILVAGRAVWFYLSKLSWPADLVFIYPRWHIDAGRAAQYVYPLGVLGLLAALWMLRQRSRAPLAAALFFVLSLAPALGFVDVFPFRYSFVADHFQYLASLGLIALLAATIVTVASRWISNARMVEAAAVVAVAAPLGILTWTQSHNYRDAATLYRATIATNPSAWLAHNNLGVLLQQEGRIQDAVYHYDAALRIEPKAYEAHQNMAIALQDLGRYDEVIRHAEMALAIRADNPAAFNVMGSAQHRLGRLNEAVASYREALRLRPEYPEASANLGAALDAGGNLEAAIHEYARAVALDPDAADLRYRFADALRRSRRFPEAIREYQETLRLNPARVEARHDLALALEAAGRLDEALAMFEAVKRELPPAARLETNIGRVLLLLGRREEAEQRFLAALQLDPGYVPARRNYADFLTQTGRPAAALEHYRVALAAQPDSAETRTNFGVALAKLGHLDSAAAEFREALRLRPGFALAEDNLKAIKR